MLIDGRKRNPTPKPPTMPWTTIICPYVFASGMRKMDRSHIDDPKAMTARKWPLSKRGPATRAQRKKRHSWAEPIQAISDEDLCGKRNCSGAFGARWRVARRVRRRQEMCRREGGSREGPCVEKVRVSARSLPARGQPRGARRTCSWYAWNAPSALTTPKLEARTRNPPSTFSHARRPPSGGAAAASAASSARPGDADGERPRLDSDLQDGVYEAVEWSVGSPVNAAAEAGRMCATLATSVLPSS